MRFMVTFGVWLQKHLSYREKAGSSTHFLLIFSFLLPVLSSRLALPLLCIGTVGHQNALVWLSWNIQNMSITSFLEGKIEMKVHFLPGQGVVLALIIIRWVGKIYVIYVACDQRREKRKIRVCEKGPSFFDSGELLDQFTLSYVTLPSDVVDFFSCKCGVFLICTWLSLEQKVRSAFAICRICKEKAVALRPVIGTNLHGEGNRTPSWRTVIRLWSSFALRRGR